MKVNHGYNLDVQLFLIMHQYSSLMSRTSSLSGTCGLCSLSYQHEKL